MSWTAEKITEISTGYWKSSVLSAAVEMGLFDTIGDGGTVDEVAGRIHASPRHLGELMNALVSLGFLVKTNGTYTFAPDAAPFLQRSGSQCLVDALRYNIDLYHLWGKLSTCMREGKPVVPPNAHLGDDPLRTKRFVLGMNSRALLMAPALLSSIDPGERATMLDVGAGPGTFSRLLMGKHTALKVTLFDLKAVLDVAEELTGLTGLAPRMSYHPGDYRTDNLPTGFDAALFSGALHQETFESAHRIFSQIFGALKPGGEVCVVDMMLAQDRTQPTFSILFALSMMLTSPEGRMFTDEEVRAELERAGFRNIRCLKPRGSPYWVVKGTKPR